ncbi:hypothetical protein I4U23_015842 [Adineta vaga]|nr:hypothetical protein I4U23_015842 [Adineta vaga]
MAFRWFLLFITISSIQLGSTKPIVDPTNDSNASPSETLNTHDNVYENSYFGILVEKPDEWYAMNLNELQSLARSIAKSLVSRNKNISNDLNVKLATNLLMPLFGFTVYPFGTENGEINANIIAIAENITNRERFNNNCDFFNMNEFNFSKSIQPIAHIVDVMNSK